jgi:hypothetical protein
MWCERYGQDFPIEEPNAAMQAFLARRDVGRE